MDPNKDTLRVLVATDSHLGYMEKDEVRRHDSFNAFDEVCAIAAEKEVDFLLLGGDLFHENKPSRTTLVRTIEILRRYCLNDRPVQFQVVSDQTINFPNRFGHVNYEDPHYNVGLPVFSIHGNHDDPAGVDNLSAIDILASCNLLNYFGKVDLGGSGVGQITLHPILLQKGSTKVALYGLGNIRDERLNRMFQTPHAVQWIRPASQDDCPVSDWFNIFVIHQNRVKSNPKNSINEHFLARFLDFIIWGHEHECLIDPQEVPGMGFHVTQPGSSVATSLIEGEAAPKHVLLLEIKGNQYRPTKIPLQSVRPFLFADVCLKDDPDIDPNDQDAVLEYLTQKVQAMIAEVPTKATSQLALQVPLIRLRESVLKRSFLHMKTLHVEEMATAVKLRHVDAVRKILALGPIFIMKLMLCAGSGDKVDYTGYSTINPQRFGQKFVGKVANPNDILLFTKAAKARRSKEDQGDEGGTLGPEELNQQNIEALVAESNLRMEILPVTELGVALHDFVNKDEKQAFHVCVQDNLDKTQTTLAQEGAEQLKEEKDVVERVTLHMKQREAEGMSKQGPGACSDGTDHQYKVRSYMSNVQAKVVQGTEGAGATKMAAGHSSLQDFSDDEEILGLAPAGRRKPPQSMGRGKSETSARGSTGRGRGSRGGRYKQTTLNMMGTGASQSQVSARTTSPLAAAATLQIVTDSDDEVPTPAEDLDMESVETSARGRKRAARGRGGRTSESRPKRGRKTATPIASYIEDDVEDDDEDEPMPSRGRRTTTSQAAPRNWGALRR